MIDPQALASDLKRLLVFLEDDLRQRCAGMPGIDARLREDYDRGKSANRTGEPYEIWRDEQLTQVAAAWILACVFVRFMEDTRLVDIPRLAGPGERLNRARDEHTLYFQRHPTETDREYLHFVFREVAKLPAAAALFDERHNPLWLVSLSGDGATRLLDFWRRIEPETGSLVHDFTPEPASPLSTRFLGDLYQDISEAARKKYALLQTPEFVEEFIIDRTLTPAIEEFGFQEVRLIDPTCGSGHFLLGAFRRLLVLWQRREPGTNTRELVQRALHQVYGVDVNPYAVAIARFRLLVAALEACEIKRLADAPGFEIHVATGDSLLHGPNLTAITGPVEDLWDKGLSHHYQTEDAEKLRRILGQQYHVVVGNPPYITVKDKALNDAYRQRYSSCHRKYSLAVPFMERFFELALGDRTGAAEARSASGYVGMITANSFMKREFGKKLVEHCIPRWNLTHVVDTSGAYIPGHGTPTVILFGRHRPPLGDKVRAVMGIRGEPQAPKDPAKGLVWRAILEQIDRPGSESEYVSVTDAPRDSFHKHPWSIGGGGAAELKGVLEEDSAGVLGGVCGEIGFGAVTREDEVYLVSVAVACRHGVPPKQVRPLVAGEDMRDWAIPEPTGALWPYDPDTLEAAGSFPLVSFLWRWRARLKRRVAYGRTQLARGLEWYEYSMFFRDRFRTPLSIAFAFVATHNHFVLDRGGKVFNRSAPVIKLPPEATEDNHLALLGLLNSSVACFWMKQVFHNKGSTVDERGARQTTAAFENFYEFTGTGLAQFPLPPGRPLHLARALDSLARELSDTLPAALVEREVPTRAALDAARARAEELRARMIGLQEELDWECYSLYGLLDETLTVAGSPHGAGGSGDGGAAPPPIRLGERAFEIVMARKMAAGELETAWFERHGSKPITQIPAHWPEQYRRLVERRIRLIETDRNIGLIERPEYKRRWNSEPWEAEEKRALRNWLLDRLEAPRYLPEIALTTCAKLADRARQDADFMQVAEVYRGRPDFDVTALVTELVESEAVPYLPVLRYKPSGLRKRALWEQTWELQRREDAGEDVGRIPVPPKYTSADFLSTTYWRLRSKLDVPKERFVTYPYAERDADPTPVVAWAGWDHLQQAQALATYYVHMKEREGWGPERLVPLLAGLLELIPWLRQWHNDIDPQYGIGMGDYYKGFVKEEIRALRSTEKEVRAWTPPARARNSRGRTRA